MAPSNKTPSVEFRIRLYQLSIINDEDDWYALHAVICGNFMRPREWAALITLMWCLEDCPDYLREHNLDGHVAYWPVAIPATAAGSL